MKWWNIAYSRSSVTALPTIAQKDLTPTWVTTTVNSRFTYTRIYVNLMRLFNWTSFCIIVDVGANPFFSGTASVIKKELEKYQSVQMDYISVNSTSSTINYEKILNECNIFSRGNKAHILIDLKLRKCFVSVMLYFGHSDQLRTLLVGIRNVISIQHVAMLPWEHHFKRPKLLKKLTLGPFC